MTRFSAVLAGLLSLAASGYSAEELSLRQAVALALEANTAVRAADFGRQAAEQHAAASRAAIMPKIDYSANWTRSDNPVFVFSSLLTEHQFGVANFQIGPLNRPDFLNNLQSVVSGEQVLYDAGKARSQIRSAKLESQTASEEQRAIRINVIAETARAYYDALLGDRLAAAARQAIQSADADLERAEAIRAAGMATDADVLSIRVHRAAVEEQKILRETESAVALAALNGILGMPLEAPHTLTSSMTLKASSIQPDSSHITRPEANQATLGLQAAKEQSASATAAFRPEIVLRGAFESDSKTFYSRGGANWTVGVGVRWNLFNGNADKARVGEAEAMVNRSRAIKDQTETTLRLELIRAQTSLTASGQRIAVTQATIAAAEESLRITRNRYQAGLSTITDLLRTENSLLEARSRELVAIHDHLIAEVMLEVAAGRLSSDSEVLN